MEVCKQYWLSSFTETRDEYLNRDEDYRILYKANTILKKQQLIIAIVVFNSVITWFLHSLKYFLYLTKDNWNIFKFHFKCCIIIHYASFLIEIDW